MKFKIYLGNMEAIIVEASSINEVEAILIDNAKTFLKDLLDEGVIKIEPKKAKELRSRIKPIQVEWLRSLLPEEQASTVNVNNVDELLPNETHAHTTDKTVLSFMTDKWLMKQLKRNPEIKTYKQLKEKINV